jgi:hypothetical protein
MTRFLAYLANTWERVPVGLVRLRWCHEDVRDWCDATVEQRGQEMVRRVEAERGSERRGMRENGRWKRGDGCLLQ